MESYRIVLSADSGYLPFAAVLITSILRNAKKDANASFAPLPFVFDILTDSASAKLLARDCASKESQQFASFCENATQIYPCSIFLHTINEDDFADIPYFSDHKNHLSSYRLRLSQVIPSDTKRVLYLDSDMLAFADVRELFAIDLGENIAAVVLDSKIHSPTFTAKNGKQTYTIPNYRNFNSGFLLLNYPRYCEAKVEEQCFEFLRTYHTGYHDQDALNAVLMGKVCYLPFAWNAISCENVRQIKTLVFAPDSANHQALPRSNQWLLNITREEYDEALQAPKIAHYCNQKPWKSKFFYSDEFGNPLIPTWRELWWEAAIQTPIYSQILLAQETFENETTDRLHNFAKALDQLQKQTDKLRAPSRALSQTYKKLRFWK